MKEKSNKKYSVSSENLAIPEVHTGKVKQYDTEESDTASVTYETVAVPEIHIKKKKKD